MEHDRATDITWLHEKSMYQLAKDRVDRKKRSDFHWVEAHHSYESSDCDGDIAKYKDPRWVQAHSQYVYYKKYGLDKVWNPKWIKVKTEFKKLDDEIEQTKKSTPWCQQLKAKYKKIEKDIADVEFHPPELAAIREKFQKEEVKKKELETKKEAREYALLEQIQASQPVFHSARQINDFNDQFLN